MLKEADKKIIKTLQKPQKTEDIIYQGTFKLQQIDSINGQLVVVEKDEPIVVGKDFYNSLRKNGKSKEEAIKEVKDRIANEIKRSKERAKEEIEMLESQDTDYSDEVNDADFE